MGVGVGGIGVCVGVNVASGTAVVYTTTVGCSFEPYRTKENKAVMGFAGVRDSTNANEMEAMAQIKIRTAKTIMMVRFTSRRLRGDLEVIGGTPATAPILC
jgi:hypothetical protein